MLINLDFKKFNEANLALEQYLVLAVLYQEPEIEILDESTKTILLELEEEDYIRILDNQIIIDGKTLRLFEDDSSVKAKEVLEHMNKLKKELGISSRAFSYRTHGREIRARIAEGIDVNLIKEMLTHRYNKWHHTEWQKYLRPSTLFNRTKFYNYIEEYEQDNSNSSSSNSLYKLVDV